jgi:hypothetical protein
MNPLQAVLEQLKELIKDISTRQDQQASSLDKWLPTKKNFRRM